MTSNAGGLKISHKCKILGYKFQVWFSSKAITNIICLKNLIKKCYRVTYDSEIATTFAVHRSAFGLPDLLFEMHPCGLHVCYPKKMGQFGFVQTVEDNMKLFSKRQVAGARRARELYEKLIYPSTADFRAIVSAGGVPGSDLTLDNVKAAEVIWGRSILKFIGNMTRSNAKRTVQSIVKVPSELIKLHREVELAIDLSSGGQACGASQQSCPLNSSSYFTWQYWKFVRRSDVFRFRHWPHHYSASVGGATYASCRNCQSHSAWKG
jgi:hypothetical protein